MMPWLSTKQAANLLGKNENTILRLCNMKSILSYRATLKAFEKETVIVIIPKKEFYKWLKKLKPRSTPVKSKDFTMNCFSFSCTRDSLALKSVVISENKFIQECPNCKSILVKKGVK